MSIKEATASQRQPHTAFRHSSDPVPRATDLASYADFLLACYLLAYFLKSKRRPEIRLRFAGLLFSARHPITPQAGTRDETLGTSAWETLTNPTQPLNGQ